jgi:hypothetical protein
MRKNQKMRIELSNAQRAALRAQRHLKPYLTLNQLKDWFQETYSQTIN